MLEVRLFGSLEVRDGARTLGPGDLGGVRPKQVLEILLAARGHRVSTARIADQLWADRPPDDIAAAIQTFVSVLRRRLVPERERARALVVTETEAYRFATDEIAFDLDHFDALLERSAREPTRAARRSLDEALALVRGEVLEDEPYASWAQDLRGTYQGRVLGARLDAAEAALAELDYGAAFAHTEAAASLDRFGERAQRLQMIALYALGRQHEALEVYRCFRARLDDELGLTPTSETRAVEAAILRQADVRSLLPRPIADHRGRRAASVRLLGRRSELEALDRAVRRGLEGPLTFVAIEGEAGFGKTRLLDELTSALEGVRVGRTRCSQLEQHLPYVPLAAAVRQAFGEAESERLHVPALRPIFPELSLEAQAPPPPADVEALEALVDLLAEAGPVVLFLDDLHWADTATIAAVSYLHRRSASLSGAVVAAIRLDLAPPDHPLHDLKTDALVRLEPLTEAELAPLGITDLYASTGGNPRFVAEAVAHQGEPPLESAFSEALVAQCRAEGTFAYRILVTAAVIEGPFDVEPLATILGCGSIELVEELDRLCERRILRVDGPRFRFRYPIVREVLAASLSPARKQLLDAQIQTRAEPTPMTRPAGRGRLVLDGR